MEIFVTRRPSLQGATIGTLTIAGDPFSCLTLEDQVREPDTVNVLEYPYGPNAKSEWVARWKIQKVTAIPRGRYRVVLFDSPHFGYEVPRLVNVPGYTAVEIHPGNKAADTDGCILVGTTCEGNLIYKSRAAFDILFPKIQAAVAAGEVYITVR